MVCKTTSTKRSTGGFTVVEMMVAAAVSSMLLVVLAGFSVVAARDCAALTNYGTLESQSRLSLDKITQQIRQTRALTAYSSTNLVFNDADGTPLEFDYNPTAQTLTRVKSGTSTVLLTGCKSFTAGLFQRNPVGGSYDIYPTANPATCKLIQLTWVCTRSILNGENTETVQSAKIVIRKQ
jgi:Tfp pilus assembly protein PilW